jgi:hypothetical protein
VGSSRYDRDRPGGEVEAGEARALHTVAELVAALPTFSALFTSKYAQQDMMWLPITCRHRRRASRRGRNPPTYPRADR